MDDESVLKRIETKVSTCDTEGIIQTLAAVPESIYANDILTALNLGIEKARKLFKQGFYALPEFLLAIDAYHRGTEFLRPRFPQEKRKAAAQIVIGVVEGDVHDMGKNIVAAVLEASGYGVVNLGYNVPNDLFLETIASTGADILALSTMMSTTLDNMRQLVEQAKKYYPNILVFVGGAPFDPVLARQIGADGYAENAITIPDETRRVLARNAAARLSSGTE